MTHHTCRDCHKGFVADSYDEAKEKYMALPKEERDKVNEEDGLVYAIFCPYCGGTNIENK